MWAAPGADCVDQGPQLSSCRACRGVGFPVEFEVAGGLGVPLNVVLVRKLGVLCQPELAMGAVGEGDVLVLNEGVVGEVHVSEAEPAELEWWARHELERRASRFRGGCPPLGLAGRTACWSMTGSRLVRRHGRRVVW